MTTIIKRAVVGGIVSTLVMAIGTFVIGEVSGYKAKALISTSLNGINMLCNTVILGASTILALMLTLLSLSVAAESKLRKQHYKNVLMIAKADTILIVTAVITFLFLNIPMTETQEVPNSWYTYIYYTSLGMASILGGGFIAVITMLYGTITNVIIIVGLHRKDHPLVEDMEGEDEEESVHNSNKDKEQNYK